LRFHVKEKRIKRDLPVLMSVDEDMPVSYEVEFDGRPAFPLSKSD
jgi:hypothetical protein